jgi:LCP family protein required for cell wall assembly
MLDYNDGKEWESVEIEDDGGEDIGDIDSDMMASDEEKDKFIGQVEIVGSGNFEVDIKKLGGSLGTVERDYSCEYISYKDDVINILLIGLDSRSNVNVGLSDVMMVVSICPSEKKIVLTSFLRDVYVMIPGYGGNRLNVAYTIGGPSLLIETIEKNYGLRIDRYATSNFFAFVEVADYIGKVKVYLNEAETEAIASHIVWTNATLYKGHPYSYYREINRLETNGAGYYELNGVQALAYARIRNLDSDFGRTNRQRVVMNALLDEVKKMSPVQWNGVLEKILPVITTNLSESDILKIMLNVGAYVKYDVKMMSMPPADNFKYMIIDGRAVIGVDQNFVRSYLKDNIYGGE